MHEYFPYVWFSLNITYSIFLYLSKNNNKIIAYEKIKVKDNSFLKNNDLGLLQDSEYMFFHIVMCQILE